MIDFDPYSMGFAENPYPVYKRLRAFERTIQEPGEPLRATA